MIRIFISILLFIHGLIHLLGFVVNWKISDIEEMSYKTTVLYGLIDVGEKGIKFIGVLWLIIALSFIISAIWILTLSQGTLIPLFIVTIFSIILCIIGLPESLAGLVFNIVLITYLFFGNKIDWLPWIH